MHEAVLPVAGVGLVLEGVRQEVVVDSAVEGVVDEEVDLAVLREAVDSAVEGEVDLEAEGAADSAVDVVVRAVRGVASVVVDAVVADTKCTSSSAAHDDPFQKSLSSFPSTCVFVLVLLSSSFVSSSTNTPPCLCHPRRSGYHDRQDPQSSLSASDSDKINHARFDGKDGAKSALAFPHLYLLGLQCSASCSGLAAQCGTGAYLSKLSVSTKMVSALTLLPASSAADRT